MPRPALRSEGLSWLSIAAPDVKELDVFNTSLGPFASKHQQKIQRVLKFQVHFQDICATTGVDPLTSEKGFWSEVLGIQIITVCLALPFPLKRKL